MNCTCAPRTGILRFAHREVTRYCRKSSVYFLHYFLEIQMSILWNWIWLQKQWKYSFLTKQGRWRQPELDSSSLFTGCQKADPAPEGLERPASSHQGPNLILKQSVFHLSSTPKLWRLCIQPGILHFSLSKRRLWMRAQKGHRIVLWKVLRNREININLIF